MSVPSSALPRIVLRLSRTSRAALSPSLCCRTRSSRRTVAFNAYMVGTSASFLPVGNRRPGNRPLNPYLKRFRPALAFYGAVPYIITLTFNAAGNRSVNVLPFDYKRAPLRSSRHFLCMNFYRALDDFRRFIRN